MPSDHLGHIPHRMADPALNGNGISRRLILGALAVGGLGLAGWRTGWIEALLPERGIVFEPMADPRGFRVLRTGQTTFGSVPLFGLDGEKPADLLAAEQAVESDLCSALFGADRTMGSVPIAYFFDYQCPICRRLTPRLLELDGVSIEWHDLAGLGPASEVAARATIAAGMQGAYGRFHERLMRAQFQANLGYVTTLAESVGIDADRLLADMESETVNKRMWLSRAAASRFGMVGTPGLVIGTSVVLGAISDGDLRRIIRYEESQPLPC